MKYAVVYSSRSGNTALAARAVLDALPLDGLVYYGPPDPAALDADLIFAGFWTDKGTCDGATAAFLPTLAGKRVALFGTAGFGGTPSYFDAILDRVKALLPADAAALDGWMCQGKMPQTVRDRYAALPDSPQKESMLQNFDRALLHPGAADLASAAAWAAEIMAGGR